MPAFGLLLVSTGTEGPLDWPCGFGGEKGEAYPTNSGITLFLKKRLYDSKIKLDQAKTAQN